MKYSVVLIFCLIAYSCQQNGVPAEIIQPKKMGVLVQKITLLELYYQSKYGVPSQYKEALDQSVNRILKNNKTTRQQFEKSLNYYAFHSSMQEKLNEDLLLHLSRKLR